MGDDKIVKFEKREYDNSDNIFQKSRSTCSHSRLRLDRSIATIECRDCHEKIDPFWLIDKWAAGEATARHRLEALRREIKKTEDKLRCKCEKCGQMTKIYR